MIVIYSRELRLMTARMRSEKRPSEIIVSTEYENMSEHPLLGLLTLQMSGENIWGPQREDFCKAAISCELCLWPEGGGLVFSSTLNANS